MSKDYYKILGVSESDSAEDIKIAYRKLARKWHPDIAGDTSDVLLKFKEINEAYEVLSNQSKKSAYDRAKRFHEYARSTGTSNESKKCKDANTKSATNPSSQKKSNFSFNWEKFEDFLNKAQKDLSSLKNENKQNFPKRGEDINTDIEISVLDVITGTTKIINILQTSSCPKCCGRKFVNGSFCRHCKGEGKITEHKKYTVKIPAGIKNGSKIRLSGEGEYGTDGGAKGDLYVTVHVKESSNYKTDGLNILKTVPIAPYEAVLGGDISVDTLQGTVSIKISPNTQNGQKIRLSGCGIVQNDKIGDMIINIEIKIPKNLTDAEINLYKELQKVSLGSVREKFYD